MRRIVHLTEQFFYEPKPVSHDDRDDTYFCDKCYEMWYIDWIEDDTSIQIEGTTYLCFKCQSEGNGLPT